MSGHCGRTRTVPGVVFGVKNFCPPVRNFEHRVSRFSGSNEDKWVPI
jgi:hypothetical protein